jgi:hypothetical protein
MRSNSPPPLHPAHTHITAGCSSKGTRDWFGPRHLRPQTALVPRMESTSPTTAPTTHLSLTICGDCHRGGGSQHASRHHSPTHTHSDSQPTRHGTVRYRQQQPSDNTHNTHTRKQTPHSAPSMPRRWRRRRFAHVASTTVPERGLGASLPPSTRLVRSTKPATSPHPSPARLTPASSVSVIVFKRCPGGSCPPQHVIYPFNGGGGSQRRPSQKKVVGGSWCTTWQGSAAVLSLAPFQKKRKKNPPKKPTFVLCGP